MPDESPALRMVPPRLIEAICATLETAVMAAVAGQMRDQRASMAVLFDQLVERMALLERELEDADA